MPTYRSTRFGRFEIEQSAILTFPRGVAGLTHLEAFAILKRRSDSVFLWLQSLEDPAVHLPIVLPWAFRWEYEIELGDDEMRQLDVERADQVSIYCLVDIGDEVRTATVDLASPVVINHTTNMAFQFPRIGLGYAEHEALFGSDQTVTPVSMREEESTTVTVLDRAA